MKKIIPLLLSCLLMLSAAGCAQSGDDTVGSTPPEQSTSQDSPVETVPPTSGAEPEETPEPSEPPADNMEETGGHILIAYFSWSGNTEQVAQEIQAQTGGDMFEIIPEEPYSDDYNETVARWHEERDSDARPAIAGEVENMEDYDIIFLGYPIWSSQLPAVNRTFLEQYDFSGKTIVPFCTHGGSRFGSSLGQIEALADGAVIADGFETQGTQAADCAEEIAQWLSSSGLDLGE